MISLYVCLALLASFLVLTNGESVKNVRIVEGVDKLSIKDEPYPDATVPEPVSGPEALYFLNGLCFAKSIDRFEYSVCPFQNITQRRVTGQYGSTLGTWGSWVIDDSDPMEHKVMKYIDGKSCGESKVDTTLILECGYEGDFEILSANDSVFCKYVIRFGLPIACSLMRK